MAGAPLLLGVEDVRGGYGEVDILNGVSLFLRKGEIVTVAGTNGAGKSTLAKAVLGLLPRVSGRILFEGADLVGLSTEDRVGRGVGYVPQVANVFAALSVVENLQVVVGVKDQRRRIAELFEAFPLLAERRRARAGSLSGGERQQLAFARALMTSPRLIILDEPTAALSPAKVAEAFELIARLPSLNVSVLVVEQRARQCLAVSQRGYILDGGKVAIEGEAAMLLADERAAELYLGRTEKRHS
ncbi:ABC transporter ATP-binding protein [Alsobacter soli]|uniref:ABC transporter ATP-binding protein n=2 Tax=Alsobacter soli TaxID=2109933 RepID=A0A2T1HR97_9HYPH|nr:ABC transporter ATP-binding protein [Alsobacter soli]PSC04170.1 ABC transporter ATP-binding protein [Alsobacter soli]